MCHAVVLKLLEGMENGKHNIYMDNYYSSPELFRALKNLGLGACGTARVDRIGMPSIFKNKKMEKGELKTRNLDGGILALQWMDKRAVTMLSTFHDSSTSTIQRSRHAQGGIESVQKPTVIQDYNKYMGGVDQSDQMLSYYGFSHRTIKWWRRAFFHLLDLSIVNAYILYKQQVNARCSHEQFRVELAKQLLFKSGQQAHALTLPSSLSPISRLTGHNFIEKIPAAPSGRPTQNQCQVCCRKKGRKRVTTTYRCKQCQVPLCVVPCFELYHTHSDPVRHLHSVQQQ